MKSIFIAFACLLMLTTSLAQNTRIPQLVNFQAVARDPGGAIVANQSIQVQLTIHEGSANGPAVYCARHKATTNNFGSFSIQLNRNTESIGCNGAPTAPFENIPWQTGSKWMQIQYEYAQNAGFTELGTTELTSAFYAFAARKAEEVTFISTTGAEEGNVLAYDATTGLWKPSVPVGSGINSINQGNGINVTQNGSSVTVTNTGDTNANDDILNTTPAQGDVSGTFSALSVDRIKGRPISSSNPVAGQVLKWDGNQWTAQDDNTGGSGGQTYFPGNGISINNNTISANDDSPSNEIQSLSLVGNQLTITPGGSSVTLPAGGGNVNIQGGSGISVSGGNNNFTVANTGDTDPFDDITTSSQAGGDLSGPFSNLNIKANAVGTQEIADGAITPLKLSFLPPTSQWINNGAKIFYNGGNVGIGTNDPIVPLQVSTIAPPTTGQITTAIIGIANGSTSTSETSRGVLGSYNIATTYGAGVTGLGYNFLQQPAETDMGLFGSSTIGVLGSGNSISTTPGIGVVGLGIGTNSVGVSGSASGTNALAGYFQGPTRTDGTAAVSTIDGDYKVLSSIASTGYGYLNTYGEDGTQNVRLTTLIGYPNNGAVIVYGANAQTEPAVVMYANSLNNGKIEIKDGNGNFETVIGVSNGGSGYLQTFGLNEKSNIALTSLLNYPNNGYIAINGNDGTTNKAGMLLDANGHGKVFVSNGSGSTGAEIGYTAGGTSFVSANIKNFRMIHPDNPDKEIWYASVEGPEAAAYERGTASMVDGVANVRFSDHFQAVANYKTMTVILTPLSADSKGMAVIEKNRDGFQVKELLGGTGSYQFDWEVKCVRKGYEDYQVVRPREEPALPAEMPTERANIARDDAPTTKGLPASTYQNRAKPRQ